jgi:outer membrane receptor protein involved in Fe transport
MTGQINVELRKPTDEDKLHVNGFFNESTRSELNVFARTNVSPKFKTAIMGHYSVRPKEHDRNRDGFLDMPTGSLLTLANKWDYQNSNSGIEGKLNVQYVQDKKEGGEVDHGMDANPLYRTKIEADRLQAYAKVGYVFANKRYNSIGSQWGFTQHNQNALIGPSIYDARQTSLYGNWLYQSIFSDTRHKYVTGFSFRYEDYNQSYLGEAYDFKEIVPGAFFEYTYTPDDRITVVAGVRADHHNFYGWLVNPRLHLRFAPGDNTVFRASAGSGMRTPLPLAENLGWMASARTWTIGDAEPSQPKHPNFGLEMEKAWNLGASFTQEFTMDYRSGLVTVDFFHTRFSNRAVADLDISPQQLHIYNLNGNSYASTFQIEGQYEVLKRLDLKVAYKIQDAQITYQNTGLRRQIFTPQSRFFANLSYISSVATYKGHWRISATAHYTGVQRIPDTNTNPVDFQLKPESPGYWLFNGQVTRVFSKVFEVYVGMENIGNYKQKPVIIDSENPFGPYFDSGLIWGPIFGSEWYVGFRYVLK